MNRTQALLSAFGYQGGTIHQVARETGLSVDDILYGDKGKEEEKKGISYTLGWFAGRTCSLEHNRRVNFPREQGNVSFWLGVAEGLIAQSKGQ